MTIGDDGGGVPAPDPIWERRLLRAAQRGRRQRRARLLDLYRPIG